ncbi:hypothetical protein C2S51_017713 [Perilla frutescens var. frutescens]|nr:hypothetical protein C2S51_017713 [Perilla frutescens var. frutescens]
MSPSGAGSLILILSAVLLLSSATITSAFNITILLGRYPGFEQFNQLLSRTQLAEEINRRRTITVLGLPNDRLATIMQMTEDVQKSILSLHIVLDYYDMIKFNKLAPASKTTLTTLYQSSGVANDKQGFIDVVHRRDGTIVFGSSMPGAPLVSALVNSVASQPFNISVLSVSQPIIAPGMDGSWVEPAAPPPPPKAAAPVPAVKEPPPPEAEEPVADEPTADAPAPSPADAPAPAPSPAADAPAEDEAGEDASDQDPEENKKKSAAVKQVVSGMTVGLVIGLASFLAGQ